ncbi:alpha/beta hydrolase [Subtercola frigoramans]|uniref:Pimeloyl-ACP methyl ester carboxylesterase n=1 Tax=Subtercola frigoramans TaxID=120298 RepID=A0ABS2L9E9_9MICO|nr:alpha/beta hydrolase [Subtercola frigoramans]MBM7473360.1 pimeloyl-ACP methyl ester carboxylesterase [Subtercola frigoramans]
MRSPSPARTRPRARNRMLGLAAAATALALVLSGCSTWFGATGGTSSTGQPAGSSTPTGEKVDAALQPFYGQTLAWADCGGGFQCAKAVVPLDWSEPTGDTVSLALIKQPAKGSNRLGSLFVNPGGPGVSAVDFVKDSVDFAVDPELQQQYDIVAFDPRGVGASTEVSCVTPSQMDSYLYDVIPGAHGSAQWQAAAKASATAFGAGCLSKTGALLGHVDTESTVRDFDALRAAIGDTGLNYLGYSYGTFIGAVYADMFPTKVNRLVLDGVVDPTSTGFASTLGQAKGFEGAMRAYLKDCLASSGCPFSGTVDNASKQVQTLLNAVDASPIRASDGRELGSASLLTAIFYPLYRQDSWPYLTQMVTQVKQGKADLAFQLADAYNGRNADGTYQNNQTEAFTAINCLDYPAVTDPATIAQQNTELIAASPTFGPWWTYGDIGCAAWPVPATRTPGPVSAVGAKPILVVGTTDDPATPYEDAQSVAKQLTSAQLITYVGEGHTAYNTSTCVKKIVNEYFLTGTVPASDPKCTN